MNTLDYIKQFECNGDDKIVALEVTFTKELVDKLLSINIKNRPIIKKNVEFFERKITSSTWARGAVVVTVNQSLTWLIDAQHHLIALKNKNYPLLRGIIKIIPDELAEETFCAMDCGSPRGLATMLGVCGVTNYAPISSILIDYKRIGNGFEGTIKTTPDEALELIDEIRDDLSVLTVTRSIVSGSHQKRLPTWVLATMIKIHHEHSELSDFICSFMNEIYSGEYSTGSVRHGPRVIREGILNNTIDHTLNAKRIYLLKAFDAYCNGRDMGQTWKRIEPQDGTFLGVKYFGVKIDVISKNKHIVTRKAK